MLVTSFTSAAAFSSNAASAIPAVRVFGICIAGTYWGLDKSRRLFTGPL